MKRTWLILVTMLVASLGINISSASAYDNNIIHTSNERIYANIPGGQIYADSHTDAYIISTAHESNSYNSNPTVIFVKGSIIVCSTDNYIIVQALKDEITAIIRTRGVVKISEAWDGLEIKPLQGEAEVTSPFYISASTQSKTLIRIRGYSRISREYCYWNTYSSFENWCLSSYDRQPQYTNDYQQAIEDRGYDNYGNYIVIRTYDPDIHICYNITYYYMSNPWWWYHSSYGYFKYVYGYGWVFIPYPIFWHQHHYYHEAPPNGHYYHGIIIKEHEESSRPPIPKENIIPYRPKETPDKNDPSKYKIRRINPDNPPTNNKRSQPPNNDGPKIVPREPTPPAPRPGISEPRPKEPNNPPPKPPNDNNQVRPKEPPKGNNQGKPPAKPPEIKKKPEPPKKEKT